MTANSQYWLQKEGFTTTNSEEGPPTNDGAVNYSGLGQNVDDVKIMYHYEKTTSEREGWQWNGWCINPPTAKWIRMSAWIKFYDQVPKACDNFGWKIHGLTVNDWVKDCVANEWNYI